MITFASFPPPAAYDAYGDHSKVKREVEDEDEMDYEFDEDYSDGKLTCPGETITSSHAFMRFVFRTSYCVLLLTHGPQ